MQPSATLSLFRVNLVASDFPTSVQLAGFMFSCSPHSLFALQVLEMIFLNSSLISPKFPTHYQVINPPSPFMFEMQP